MRHFSNEILTRAITFRDGKRQELHLARPVPRDLIILGRNLCHQAMVNKIRGTVLR
ncbi:MAG: hypothetical protein MUO95_07455 [Methanoregula sp.]|nr:hypothetical protein [Methanoregula sp.]